jgi:hypothetical protein
MTRLLTLLVLATASAAAGQDVEALVLVPHNYGANTILNVHDYDAFGWRRTFVGLTDTVAPCPAYGATLGGPPIPVALHPRDLADLSRWDVLALMPASQYAPEEPYADVLADPDALDLVRRAVADGLVVYATCAGVRVLAAAGVLDGVTVTGHERWADEYRAAGATYLGAGVPPVIDGTIVTSTRGLYFHEANSEAIAIALERRQAGAAGNGAAR